MRIEIESLIDIIVKEVIAVLSKGGVDVASPPIGRISAASPVSSKERKRREVIDMRSYKTPVLTENMLASLDAHTIEIVIPKETVITPGARETIKKKNLTVITNSLT